MVEALLFTGAGAGAGEKNPGAGQKRTGSATLLTVYCICTIAYVFLVENVSVSTWLAGPSPGGRSWGESCHRAARSGYLGQPVTDMIHT